MERNLPHLTLQQHKKLFSLGIIKNEEPIYGKYEQVQAVKWLRDLKGIHITPSPSYNEFGCIYLCFIATYKDGGVTTKQLNEKGAVGDYIPPAVFKTYEDAIDAGLNEVLEINE